MASATTDSTAHAETISTDVLIVGAGPVGLLLAYQLRLFSVDSPTPINVHIVEAHSKPLQQRFGRAVTFWPRSMELLSAMGLADEIEQQCYAVRHSAAYDKHGHERPVDGAWAFIESITDTKYRFASVLRQKYVEEIFREKLLRLGVEVQTPCKFEGLEFDETVEPGEMGKVTASVVDGRERIGYLGRYKVRCRYLIGCDGSRTKVRDAAGIESVGSRTEDRWVRIDGVLKHTTMPKPRCYGAIESETYGNILWIPLDHGATRIGYRFDPRRWNEYEGKGLSDEEIFVREAMECVRPHFEIEYEKVDWASVYSVGQRVAKSFWAKECVFLAGDSCHTHSSGAGQGMNAGVNDAANLGWKLALALLGKAKREVLLSTYDEERRPLSEKLIRYDEGISVLVSGRVPDFMRKKGEEEDPNVVLGRVLREAKGFNTGLTLAYGGGAAVRGEGNHLHQEVVIPAPALPGQRAPDVKVLLPALWEGRWLQTLMPNRADFYLLTFVGKGKQAKDLYRAFKSDIEDRFSGAEKQLVNGEYAQAGSNGSMKPTLPVRHITILPAAVDNGWHELGFDPMGKVYYDGDGSATERYAVDVEHGTVFVIRPDGWIGAKMSLSVDAVAGEVTKYLQGLLLC